jgi:hypothetical protein
MLPEAVTALENVAFPVTSMSPAAEVTAPTNVAAPPVTVKSAPATELNVDENVAPWLSVIFASAWLAATAPENVALPATSTALVAVKAANDAFPAISTAPEDVRSPENVAFPPTSTAPEDVTAAPNIAFLVTSMLPAADVTTPANVTSLPTLKLAPVTEAKVDENVASLPTVKSAAAAAETAPANVASPAVTVSAAFAVRALSDASPAVTTNGASAATVVNPATERSPVVTVTPAPAVVNAAPKTISPPTVVVPSAPDPGTEVKALLVAKLPVTTNARAAVVIPDRFNVTSPITLPLIVKFVFAAANVPEPDTPPHAVQVPEVKVLPS